MLVEREQKHWDATWARTTDSAGWLNKTKLAFRMLHTSQLGRAYIQLQKEYRLGDSFTPFVAHVMSYSSEIKVVYRHCSFSLNEFIPDLNLGQLNTMLSQKCLYQLIYGTYYTSVNHVSTQKHESWGEANRPTEYVHS